MEQILALNEAIKILKDASRANCSEAQAIYNLTFHAAFHLDKQIKELLADNPRHDGIDGHCADACPCLAVNA